MIEEEFRCSCISCGRLPKQEEGVLSLWVESAKGMLCEDCLRRGIDTLDASKLMPGKGIPEKEEFCCFCVLCGRSPPDPAIRIWVETEWGCLCATCLRRVIGEGIGREIEKMLEE